MTYKTSKRKWGEGYTKYAPHGSGAGYHADGEALLDTVLASSLDLGAYSEASELLVSAGIVEDNIQQEQNPIQLFAGSYAGSFKVDMSMGDIQKVALAMGLTAPQAVIMPDSGKSANAVVLGIVKPAWLSLVHSVPNVHSPSVSDHHYMPRVQVEPGPVWQALKDKVRTAPITFRLAPSAQDEFENLNGTHAAVKDYEESPVDIKGLRRDTLAFAASDDWAQPLALEASAVFGEAYETAAGVSSLIGPGTMLAKPGSLESSMSQAVTGSQIALGMGVEDGTGEGEIHNFYSDALTWTATAKFFEYPGALIILALDRYGHVIEPGTITITPGIVGAGTVVAEFSEAIRGTLLIIKVGPGGSHAFAQAASVTWQVDGDTIGVSEYPPVMQCYDAGGVRIEPGSVTWDSADNLITATFSAAQSGNALLIW